MAQRADWTKLDDLLELREWLKNISDDEFARAVPKTCRSRSEMVATLDELIGMCSKQKAT
jgi:hypothetical protein